MKYRKTLLLLISILLFMVLPTLAATDGAKAPMPGWLEKERFAVSLKYTGLTYHPDGGENDQPYPRSLDSRDFWVVQVGGEAAGDYVLHEYFYLRAVASLYRDCADVWAGLLHFGFRVNYDTPFGLSMRVGVGPSFLWRENWFGKVQGYTRDSFFGPAKDETFQTAFIWHGGDIELEYRAWDRVSLVYSMIPGYPEVIHSSAGARYRF